MSSPQRPTPTELVTAPYRKSTFSGANNECVEIAELGPWIGVRDSKNPAQPALCFAADDFATFLAEVKAGRFTI